VTLAAIVAPIAIGGPLVITGNGNITLVAVGAWLLACQLTLVTYRIAATEAVLVRPWPYRAALGGALATGIIEAILAVRATGEPAGHVALATAGLAIAILAWRALARPRPKRAALVAIVAVLGTGFAFAIDVGREVGDQAIHASPANLARMQAWVGELATEAMLAPAVVGALAAIAALGAFQRGGDLPEARANFA